MLPRYPGWFSATFSGARFFSVGTPPVGNGDLVGFWPVLGTSRNSGTGPKTENRNFPALGVPKSRKKSYHAIRDGCPQLFYTLPFGQTDPQGREFEKYGDFRPFWPRAAFGTWRNPGRGRKTEKTQFPGARGPKIEGKKLPRYPGWLSATFYRFARPDPHM